MSDDKKKEIATIKERIIKVNLSEADCERLALLCGKYDLTVGKLIENFIGDLVGGTYTNGSDERMYADQWLRRCWFGMYPEKTLLNHLIVEEFNPEEYLEYLDDIEKAKKELARAEEHLEEVEEEEKKFIAEDIRGWNEAVEEMLYGWNPEYEPDMEEEIVRIRKWVEEKNRFVNGEEN